MLATARGTGGRPTPRCSGLAALAAERDIVRQLQEPANAYRRTMTEAGMPRRGEFNPQTYARVGGLLYLLIIAAGLFGELAVRQRLVVSANAAATASNILASEPLWRSGVAGDLLMHVCDIPLILIFYVLLKPVSKHGALLYVLFNLAQTASLIAFKLNSLVGLSFAEDRGDLGSFQPAQRQALMFVFLRADEYGFGIGLIFFGCACLVLGYLIWRSTFLPRMIGALMQVAGVCYLIDSFALVLAPKVAGRLFPAILVPSFIAELSLCLWLLLRGVDVQKWQAAARVAPPAA